MADEAVRGIILRQDGDQLVVRATDADVRRFASAQAVEVRERRTPDAVGTDWMEVMRDGLYDRYGRRVALVQDLVQRADRLDVTSMGSRERQYLDGPYRVEIRAVGL